MPFTFTLNCSNLEKISSNSRYYLAEINGKSSRGAESGDDNLYAFISLFQELRLSNGDSSIAVRYGTELDEEYQRLVKHAHRRAAERAWEDEKFALSLGLDGRRQWTDEEREQLLSKGSVHGYRPSDLYSLRKYPQLADDPNNVAFLKDSRRKRRKSHGGSGSDVSLSNHEHEHEHDHHPHHNHYNSEDSFSSLRLYDAST